MSYSFLSVLLRTLNVSFPILSYLCYIGPGRLVVLYFVIDVIEDLEGWLRILCYRCYRELGRLVVVYVVIDVIEDLEGWLRILCYRCY